MCTAKQRKVSYARVLVDVDITLDFVTEIRVRENNGREFIQKAIPEWRPYFCQKCNKLGHVCKDKGGEDLTQYQKNKEDNRKGSDKQVWMPTKLAEIMHGVTSLEELRMKLGKSFDDTDKQDKEGNKDTEVAPSQDNSRSTSTLVEKGQQQHLSVDDPAVSEQCNGRQAAQERDAAASSSGIHQQAASSSATLQNEEDQGGWTPVQPNRTTRRMGHQKFVCVIADTGAETEQNRGQNSEPADVENKIPRDGNPIIPSSQ